MRRTDDLNGDGIVDSQDIQAANAKDADINCNGDGNTPANRGNGKAQDNGNVHGQDVSCIATRIVNISY
jgi:hypothetical protein